MALVTGTLSPSGAAAVPLDATALGAHGLLRITTRDITDAAGVPFLSVIYGLRFDWADHVLAGDLHDLLLPGAEVDAVLATASGVLHLAQVPRVSASATFSGEPEGCSAPGSTRVGLLAKLHLSLTGAAAIGLQEEIVEGGSVQLSSVAGTVGGGELPLAPGFLSAVAGFSDPSVVGLAPCPSRDSLVVIGIDATDGRLRAIIPAPAGDGTAGFSFSTEDLVPGTPAFSDCFP